MTKKELIDAIDNISSDNETICLAPYVSVEQLKNRFPEWMNITSETDSLIQSIRNDCKVQYKDNRYYRSFTPLGIQIVYNKPLDVHTYLVFMKDDDTVAKDRIGTTCAFINELEAVPL